MALYTLRFDDYDQARAAATALGFWDLDTDQLKTSGQSQREDGSWFGWAIDDIGQDPVTDPGTYDDEGVEITPPTTLPGYFVNVTGELPPAAMAFLAPGGYGCAGRLFAGTEPGAQPPPFQGTTPGETITHDGATWTWQQARWSDGTFRADDPDTQQNEGHEWVIQ